MTAGADVAINGDFGKDTQIAVLGFQALAGLPTTGQVDAATKHALHSGRISMATWSPLLVERRIRQVFRQDPDHAVAVARCLSFLNPHHVMPDSDGNGRTWGVFQISEAELTALGGDPRKALDPEWNIQTAHRLWSKQHDFTDWPLCNHA